MEVNYKEEQLLKELRRVGFWDMESGSAELNVDRDGQLVKIVLHSHYRISTGQPIVPLTNERRMK